MTKDELINDSALKAMAYVNTNFPIHSEEEQIELCSAFLYGYIECAKDHSFVEGYVLKDKP